MFPQGALFNLVPFGEVLKKWLHIKTVFEVITYEFERKNMGFTNYVMIDEQEDAGYVTVNIGQAEKYTTTFWTSDSIMSVFGILGGQAVSIIAIVNLVILGHYKQFAY